MDQAGGGGTGATRHLTLRTGTPPGTRPELIHGPAHLREPPPLVEHQHVLPADGGAAAIQERQGPGRHLPVMAAVVICAWPQQMN